MRPYLSSTFHFDVEYDVASGFQDLFHFVSESTVQLSRVFGMLEKFPGLQTLLETRSIPEIIIDTILLARPGLPSRRRYREPKSIREPLAERLGDRRLAPTRRRGQDDYSRGHSKFSSCSRNFSRSPFIAITV